jgi:hypothetical protein
VNCNCGGYTFCDFLFKGHVPLEDARLIRLGFPYPLLSFFKDLRHIVGPTKIKSDASFPAVMPIFAHHCVFSAERIQEY